MTVKCKTPLTIQEWCRGCAICIALCPENVLVLGAGDKAASLYPERCTSCRLCETRCPDQAIAVIDNEDI